MGHGHDIHFIQALGSLTLCAAEFDTLETQRGFHRESETLVSRVMDGWEENSAL